MCLSSYTFPSDQLSTRGLDLEKEEALSSPGLSTFSGCKELYLNIINYHTKINDSGV